MGNKFIIAAWCCIVVIVVAVMSYGLVNDAAARRYRIQAGNNIYYCNDFSYDDDGSLLLSNCSKSPGSVVIYRPSDTMVEAQ